MSTTQAKNLQILQGSWAMFRQKSGQARTGRHLDKVNTALGKFAPFKTGLNNFAIAQISEKTLDMNITA